MTRREAFARAYPDGFFLDPDDGEALARYARRCGFQDAAEGPPTVSRAGEGNMNLTLRLVTGHHSIILKQARPWVEKYPSIPAPAGRSRVEHTFYEVAGRRPELARAMPRLLGSDPSSGVLALEDLGEARDFTALYRQGELPERDQDELLAFLVALHRPFPELTTEERTVLRNPEMRALNHEHIFRLPLARDNGLDLDAYCPGLAAAATPIKEDPPYREGVAALGRLFLADGEILVHGDYFPGSWLRTAAGLRIIDPEFCFLGTPAFDVGVMLGHLFLARQPGRLGERLLEAYRAAAPGGGDGLRRLARGFAGVEIMRRLIGVAQLPLEYGLEERVALLRISRDLVLS